MKKTYIKIILQEIKHSMGGFVVYIDNSDSLSLCRYYDG